MSDLRQSELVTPSVIAAVEAQRTAQGGRGLALGLGRCLYHLPTLKGVCAQPGVCAYVCALCVCVCVPTIACTYAGTHVCACKQRHTCV